MFLQRWDAPDEVRLFGIPRHPAAAQDLISHLESAPAPSTDDVILYVLRVFRQLRASIPSADALDAIRVFNALLAGTEAVRLQELRADSWHKCSTVGDALKELSNLDPDLCCAAGLADLAEGTLATRLGDLLGMLLAPGATTGFELEPGLLLRHAAGDLYQEAHIIIERENRQLYLPTLASDGRLRGSSPKEVHFTPVTLARSLTEKAIAAREEMGGLAGPLEILDPACGSGVFLQEALRVLQVRGFPHRVVVRGFDVSPISCAMAQFCLARAEKEATIRGMSVEVDIRRADALTEPWGNPAVILMNPPFASLEAMNASDKSKVSDILGPLKAGRVDKAMAFIWKAAAALNPGAVVASLLPAALLETKSGTKWRDALAQTADVRLIGHFRGYGYFPGSTVEPAFVMLTKPAEDSRARRPSVTIVTADEGAEDAAIRALRRHDPLAVRVGTHPGDVYDIGPEFLSPASWLPRSASHASLVEKLSATGMSTVGQLFHVRQGIRTGRKPTFVLPAAEFSTLQPEEQKFFRSVASSSNIRDGLIKPGAVVFYPYTGDGLVLTTEDEVASACPEYYRKWLQPAKSSLQSRAGIDLNRWWALTWGRSWQWVRHPKLVTKSFGESGGFAYDDTGDFVVVQGYAWLSKGKTRGFVFDDSSLPWAYLAILNSPLFEMLLACHCPRVRGGQFDLAAKYVNHVHLPDLADDLRVSGQTVQSLAQMGRAIHRGKMPSPEDLNQAAISVYGLPPEWFVIAQ